MAKQSKIQALIASAETRKPRTIESQLDPKIFAAIKADLEAVVEAEREGKPTPANPQLAEYLRGEYKFSVSRTTVGSWLNRVRKNTFTQG